MAVPDLFRRNDAGADIPNRAEVISRYKRVRDMGRKLNQEMVARLSRDVLDEGGKKLGIVQNGVFVFNSEDESAVLMDYCLYDVRRNGHNAIERYLLDSPPAPDSEAMVCLRSMQQAIYSVFMVESVIPGFGVTVGDLLADRTREVAEPQAVQVRHDLHLGGGDAPVGRHDGDRETRDDAAGIVGCHGFTISRFAGVRVLAHRLTGKADEKYILIQPAMVQDSSAVADSDTQTSDYVGQPVHLVR